MSKGYVYIMTTAVDGIIKIGRSDNWTRRCQEQLEANGYKNMNGLKTYFVAKVDNQEEIESIMHDIFRESRVSNFEMFAVDKDRAKRVLSKMGEQVYPEENKVSTNTSITNESKYFDFWTKFNNEINKSNSNIKPKTSGFNKNYYLAIKNKIFISISCPKDEEIGISIGSDYEALFNSNILAKLSQINSLSTLVFKDSSYTKNTGKRLYIIATHFKYTNMKDLITIVEPLYNYFMN